MNNEKSFEILLSSIVRPAVGFAILIGALALTSSAQEKANTTTAPTTAGSAPVTVVNTTANPVPVSGVVSVSGTSTVNAQQSGSWNVGISGNSAANPFLVRDVDQASRKPYAQTIKMTFNSSDRAVLGNFDVPAGKRLVIESFSVFGKFPSGMKLVESSINAFQGGDQFGTQHFAPVFTGNTEETFEPGVFIVSSGPMHLDAVAGTGTVTVRLERDHITIITVPFSFEVNITGYLVDALQ